MRSAAVHLGDVLAPAQTCRHGSDPGMRSTLHTTTGQAEVSTSPRDLTTTSTLPSVDPQARLGGGDPSPRNRSTPATGARGTVASPLYRNLAVDPGVRRVPVADPIAATDSVDAAEIPAVLRFPIAAPRAATSRVTIPTGRSVHDEVGAEDTGPFLFRFNRRREARSQVSGEGWAQLLMCDPMRTLLGGAMPIDDISRNGIAVHSAHAVPIGDAVEVRLAPYRVRGRIGRVVRCERVEPAPDTLRKGYNGGRYRVVIAFSQVTFAA